MAYCAVEEGLIGMIEIPAWVLGVLVGLTISYIELLFKRIDRR